jgi:DNA-nicking Smr family endonuclease
VKARRLSDLGAVKKAIADARREAADHELRQRASVERLEHEGSLFSRSVGSVHTVAGANRAPIARPRPPAQARQRELDEKAVLRDSLSDEIDVESLLDTDEALSFRQPGIGLDVVRKLRRGGWAIQAHLDLHGLRREQARTQLGSFLREAAIGGLRCVRIVHGKGNGSPGRQPVLKSRVHGWLVQRDDVIAFVQARASEGGHGALVVLLRPTKHSTTG